MHFLCFVFVESVFAMIFYKLCIFFVLDNIFDLRTRKDQFLEVVPVVLLLKAISVNTRLSVSSLERSS